ncbi:MAG TPA: HAD-IIB family hydrolase [Opitutaceae bacterium]|nr:HAD-IIB family hydrolase [Opitutaceae bacterium]
MSPGRIRLFSTDLDGTILGSPAASWRFSHAWLSLSRGLRPLLAYNTGRSVADTLALIAARHLPEPDYIVGSLGTELHDSLYRRADDHRALPRADWSLEKIEQIVGRFPEVKRQPAEFRHAFKSSWFWERARREELAELTQHLRDAGLAVHVSYSCRYFLDVVPAWAGKGNALARLCQRLDLDLKSVLVAGDTANDTSMFLLPGVRGIAVGNALPELLTEIAGREVYLAPSAMADGVLEGLRHFGVIAELPAFDAIAMPPGFFRHAS